MRLALVAALLVACGSPAPMKLGGRTYTGRELARGRVLYDQGCRACHGDAGDGHGWSAQGLWPVPRDLTQGLYKFGRVPTPGLPPDRELARILRSGLNGTGMLPWTLGDRDLDALLGYVKSFSPRWQTEVAGEPVVAGSDPFPVGDRAAIERGEALYHGKAMCSTCHPAYVTRARLYAITRAFSGTGVTAYSPAMYTSRVKDTEYCWRWKDAGPDRECAEPTHAVPPDFTHDPMRAVRSDRTNADLFETIGAGITGANMPPWKGALTDEEIWLLAHYVASLADMRGHADALWSTLRSDENVKWTPPE